MTSSPARLESSTKHEPSLAPREHGFWVILGVVVPSALSRTGGSRAAWIVAVPVVIAAIALGSILGRRIRRSATLQLVATCTLSLAGVPVELAGGASPAAAAFDAGAWVAIFTASTLAVRACFARASRRQREHATALAGASVAVPVAFAGLFALASLRTHALATLVAGAAMAGIAVFQPTAKHLKAVGIAIAAISVVAAVVLRIS
jgi:hypothetical protein